MKLNPMDPASERPPSGSAGHAEAFFGTFFSRMKRSLVPVGSELGLGMTLFSLTVSIRAALVIEIGRYMGFSTLCLGAALKFLDLGWEEPAQHKQRPDVNYPLLEGPKTRKLYSIDPCPTAEALNLVKEAELDQYVEFINKRSSEVRAPENVADLIFIDGDHSYAGCKSDVEQYVPYLRPGGYFILHDCFGWYDPSGRNNSPVAQVANEIAATKRFQHLLVDTGYPSFVIFRKPSRSDETRDSKQEKV